MTKGFSRRFFLGGVTSLAAGSAWSATDTMPLAPLTSPWPKARNAQAARRELPPVDDLLARADLGGKVSWVVADGATGAVLEARNPLLPMPPASVAKAATATYALETLGEDFRFRTRLLGTGPLANGRLEGDLILQGSGDPMLTTDGLSDLARALRQAGLREIAGRFLVDASALPYLRVIDAAQPEHLGYNPSVCGLNLNYNRVFFEWKRGAQGYAISMDARSEKYRPRVAISRMQVVERAYPVYTYRQDGEVDRWTVARGALGDGGGRWLPVRRPDLYAGEVFVWLAGAQGIHLPGAQASTGPVAGTELAAIDSRPLSEISRLMLKYSVNLTAEVLGLSASQARGARPASLLQSAGVMNGWMHETLAARRVQMVDHSGLSDFSRLSAIDMVKALARADRRLHGLLKEIVPLDDKGAANRDAPYQIQAKTGSLNFVSTLAGYVETGKGRPLTFAIFTGDLARRAAIPREMRERPKGARSWARRSRWLQHRLIERWARFYDV